MTTINPYLTFNGNCEEAFNFYKSVFGGEFSFLSRYSELPSDYKVNESEKENIMHMSLPIGGDTVIMGSDSSEAFGKPATFGDNISISITTDSKEKADMLFNTLSNGGEITMPIQDTFWGDYFGSFRDKYGIYWMVGFNENQNS